MAGWDDLEAVQHSLVPPASNDFDKLCLRVFSTEEGQKLLKTLRDQTIEQPCWGPGTEPSYGYFLEGRCSLVKEIETRINKARNV
jgi:hypothetical protein|tara:strand:+ start:5222 stop:5476 length:255 start_codon:yes stop_codon:yes gene_type:complete